MASNALEELQRSIAWDRAHPIRYKIRRLKYHLTHLTHPKPLYYANIYWPVRRFIERGRRGWSVRDTWSLDIYLAGVIAESVAYLANEVHGYPAELTPEKWHEILTEISESFRLYSECRFEDGNWQEIEDGAKKAFGLMAEWFPALWD